MEVIKYPQDIDKNNFTKDNKSLNTLYGLPKDVIYCKICVISNQRPNSAVEYQTDIKTPKKTIKFDSNGVCDACNYKIEKEKKIDWDDREKQLIELCDKHRRNDGSYDCIVPGSGGKDSIYQSNILKKKYGMHPLTVTWAPHIYTDWGWKNFQAWIHSGLDNYLFTPNGKVHRLLTRLSTELLMHPFQPFIIGQKIYAPKMAVQFNIPLVFYGESEAEYGNPIADTLAAKRNNSFFTNSKENMMLGGVSIRDLKSQFGLNNNNLDPYLPANPELIEEKKVEVHYLGYYHKWHPQSAYYYAVENAGFQASPERTVGTYSKYSGIDDRVDDFHFYTTGIKFGIGRASYDASQEVRSGDINRDEAVRLVKRFDHEYPERFAEEIFNYLSIDQNEYPIASKMFEQPVMDRVYFNLLADHFRSPHLWINEDNSWQLRYEL